MRLTITRLVGAALITAFVAGAVLLAACGGATTDSPSSPAATQSGSPAATPTATAYVSAPKAAVPAAATSDRRGGRALQAPLWDFGLDILSRQAAKTGEDVVVSPVSLSAVLSMTQNGARGETAEQMRAALAVDKLSPQRLNAAWADLIAATDAMKPGQARIANSLWLENGAPMVPAFLDVNRDYYAADVRDLPADLSAAPAQINDWVSRRTGGRIKDLVNEVLPDTALVLVNTVFVKVGWEVFEEDATTPAGFTLADGTTVRVPTMKGSMEAGVVEEPEFVAVPVQTNATPRLWIIVPKGDETPESVAALLQQDGPQSLERHAVEALVDLRLPRFRIEYTADDLGDDLVAMGMADAFSPGADFTGMADLPGLWIGGVVHKAMIDVNEQGVEAAAGSAVLMTKGAPATRRLTVRADRPFLAVLTGETGAPLFMAVVRDPR